MNIFLNNYWKSLLVPRYLFILLTAFHCVRFRLEVKYRFQLHLLSLPHVDLALGKLSVFITVPNHGELKLMPWSYNFGPYETALPHWYKRWLVLKPELLWSYWSSIKWIKLSTKYILYTQNTSICHTLIHMLSVLIYLSITNLDISLNNKLTN